MIPEDLHYSREHEWVRADGDIVTVGVTHYAQDQLGDIVFVELPAAGEAVTAGSVIGELESTKSVSDVFSPVDGEIVERNEALESTPETINGDPYGEGWLLRVRVAGDPTEGLLDAAGYAAHIAG
ncbi:glycine cleavage system protein GcvH [Aeromicrobium sp. YIM 150415]|uniref:Glycine cleavage system H protein n=1 Tax=Aeromicrobium piscarium TaxID=2590901 RepID=A0A554SFF4_9ACTN|nr:MULTISPECIES: glycine cleavage system protein GcvH [Aeromicrobium]MBM9465489.1 glycine cleavage system protein GcvH [Aeromicrobium sp. YIM 150415]TSD65082.1 glycine cleavage system protein GcvH [Aeromicrobium piscarium]